MNYRVNDIYPCIQGEGAMTGTPMALVRLHGCSVGCAFCDTKETWFDTPGNRRETVWGALGTNAKWAEVTPKAIVDAVKELASPLRWVLLTGGEPADQDLGELIDALHAAGHLVAVETSGTAPGVLGTNADWICVSPKLGMAGGKRVLPEVMAMADEVKMVVGRAEDIERLRDLLGDCPTPGTCRVSLQPMSTNPTATDLCIETSLKTGWALSLQTHKWINAR